MLLLAMLLPAMASAADYDADMAKGWLEQFAQALAQIAPINDPMETADPARAGQYLIEYEFGTVLATAAQSPAAEQIVQIDVTNAQVTDCLGLRVGMGLADALGGAAIAQSNTDLSVFATQEAGIGWSWAYVGDAGVYGVERITYGGEGAAMKEYTLTHVINTESGTIEAIRFAVHDATQAQAEDGMKTAQEIAGRQLGEVMALASGADVFAEADATINGAKTVYADVADMAVHIGEPAEIQTLPGDGGRILIYDGMAAALYWDEATGVERVHSVNVTGGGFAGPRGLRVGMSVQEAAALFRCDADVYAVGGVLYMEGEAAGEPPYGELTVDGADGVTLRYIAQTEMGNVYLEIGIEEYAVAYWRLHAQDSAQAGA